jgi:hypothetical protein
MEACLNWLPGQLRLSVPCGNSLANNLLRFQPKQGLAGRLPGKFNRLFSVFPSYLIVMSEAIRPAKEVSREL